MKDTIETAARDAWYTIGARRGEHPVTTIATAMRKLVEKQDDELAAAQAQVEALMEALAVYHHAWTTGSDPAQAFLKIGAKALRDIQEEARAILAAHAKPSEG